MTYAPAALLSNFFGANFHQDWDLDYGSPEDVVDGFAREVALVKLEATAQALSDWLASANDAELKTRLYREFGSCYKPPDKTEREWLGEIVARLTLRAAERRG